MVETVENKTIQDHIIDINQRILRLESGGKAFTATADPGIITDTLDPGEEAFWVSQVGFSNASEDLNPNSNVYITIYIDGSGVTSQAWPYGSGVNMTDHFVFWWHDRRYLLLDEPGAGNIVIALKNLDSVPHEYEIRLVHLYMSGQSGSGVEAV